MALTIFTGRPLPFGLAAPQQHVAGRSHKAEGAATTPSSPAGQIGGPASSSPAQQSADLLTQWGNALGDRHKADLSALAQLQALNKQMRSSRHDEASLRLQQLLAQFRILRMLGGSAKAMADLAKQIKAAANDLSASGDAGSVDPSTDAAGGADAASAPTDATGATAAGATAATTASADPANAGEAASTQPASDSAAPATAAADPGKDAGSSTSAATNASDPSQGQQAATVWQQLIQQVDEAGAKAKQKAEDELLLEQARAAIGQIERMAKRAEEQRRHKVAVHHLGNAVPDTAPSPAAATASSGTPTVAQVRSSPGLDKIV